MARGTERSSGVQTPRIALADLQRLHLHHLRHGAAGVAANLETLAAARDVGVSDVVACIDGLVDSGEPEVAAWAQVVAPFVRAAIATGALEPD